MMVINRLNVTSLTGEKHTKVGVNIPEELSIELAQIQINRQRAGIKGYTKRTQVIESTAMGVEINQILDQLGRSDFVDFTRAATEAFAMAIDMIAQAKGIPASEVKMATAAKWIKDMASEHGGIIGE